MKRYIHASQDEFSKEYLNNYQKALLSELRSQLNTIHDSHMDSSDLDASFIRIDANIEKLEVYFEDADSSYGVQFRFNQLKGLYLGSNKYGMADMNSIARSDAKFILDNFYKEYHTI